MSPLPDVLPESSITRVASLHLRTFASRKITFQMQMLALEEKRALPIALLPSQSLSDYMVIEGAGLSRLSPSSLLPYPLSIVHRGPHPYLCLQLLPKD